MPFSHRKHHHTTVAAPPKRRGLFSRRPAHHHTTHHTTTTTTTAAPRRRGLFSRRPVVQHHHQRKPSLGDKISGALLKLRGSLTNRPGVKVRFPLTSTNPPTANPLTQVPTTGRWNSPHARNRRSWLSPPPLLVISSTDTLYDSIMI